MTLLDWDSDKYLVDFETISYEGPITDAPFVLKVGWITRYLAEIIFPDAIKSVVNGGELAGLLLTFSIVDYLAGYYVGKRSQARDFIAFMKRYFPEQYKPYLEDIYQQLRCGLVHNLTLLNPWIPSSNNFIIEPRSDMHLQYKDGKIIFSIYHFIEDVRRAMIMYGYDMIMNPVENQSLIKSFQERFNSKNGSASVMLKTH
jgi:hypothetical protein